MVELPRLGVIVAEEMDMTDDRQQSVSPPAGPPGATPSPAPGAPAGWGQPPQRPGWDQPSLNDRQLRKRQEMIDAALPLLPPGTQVRQMMVATTLPAWLFIPCLLLAILPGALLYIAIQRVRLVAVADDAIYVLAASGWFGRVRAKRVLAVVPRTTRLGPPAGFQTKVRLGMMTLHLGNLGDNSYREQVLAADAWGQSQRGTGWAQPAQAMAAEAYPNQAAFVAADAPSAPRGYPPTPGAQPGWSAPAGQGTQPGSTGIAVPHSAAPMFAGFWIRLVAFLIDAVIMVVLCLTIIGIVVAIPYMPVMWWKKGATFGQKALGLKVVRAADGGPVDGMMAFIRFIVLILEWIGVSVLIGLVGFIWAAFEPRKRAWHDVAAGTVVIRAS